MHQKKKQMFINSLKYLEFLKSTLLLLNFELKMKYFFNAKWMGVSHQQQLEPRCLGSRTQSITYTSGYTKLAECRLFSNTRSLIRYRSILIYISLNLSLQVMNRLLSAYEKNCASKQSNADTTLKKAVQDGKDNGALLTKVIYRSLCFQSMGLYCDLTAASWDDHHWSWNFRGSTGRLAFRDFASDGNIKHVPRPQRSSFRCSVCRPFGLINHIQCNQKNTLFF